MSKSDIIRGYRAHITAGNLSIMLLRLSYAAFLVVIGIDKILHTDMIAPWVMYIGPVIHTILPVSPVTVISVEGLIEIALGIVLLTTWIRLGAIFLLVTTLLLCVDLFLLGFYNLALHDLLFCAGTFVLISHYNSVYKAKFEITPFSEVAPVT
ncbi:hypothetical protein BH11PAT2_BH11PAT2_07280 [soil metagenome]